jgi:hypothetical protein
MTSIDLGNQRVLHDGEHPLLLGEETEALFQPVQSAREGLASLRKLDWRQALGGIFILVGLLALALGWLGIARTSKTYEQLSFLLSGGLGGLGLIGVGAVLLTSYEHFLDRFAIARLEARLDRLEATGAWGEGRGGD